MSLPKLNVNVWDVCNLVYATALQKYLISTSLHRVKIFAFVDEDALLTNILKVASLGLPTSKYFKNRQFCHYHTNKNNICRYPSPFWPKGHLSGWLNRGYTALPFQLSHLLCHLPFLCVQCHYQPIISKTQGNKGNKKNKWEERWKIIHAKHEEQRS